MNLEKTVQPWIEENAVNERIESFDGISLNTYHCIHPDEKGAVVMVHGFCEFFGKFHEMFYRFYQAGYSVFFLELRGHGKSGNRRQFEDHRVSVGSFDEYVGDLHSFVTYVWEKSETKKLMLYSHSMGGCVSALYLQKYPDDFCCAVLSSPMLQIDYGKVPEQALGALSVYSKVSGNEDEMAPGQGLWTGEYSFSEDPAMSEERYEYQFNQRLKDESYQTWGATWGWANAARNAAGLAVKNAKDIMTPILLFQAGNDSVVKPEGQNLFKERSRYTSLVKVDGVRHEIYAANDEIVDRYVQDILVYYNAHL